MEKTSDKTFVTIKKFDTETGELIEQSTIEINRKPEDIINAFKYLEWVKEQVDSLLSTPDKLKTCTKNLFNHFFGNRESAWDMAKQFGEELEPGSHPVSDELLEVMRKNFDNLSVESMILFFYFICNINQTNTLKRSFKKISKELNIPTRTVKSAVIELENIGILHKVKHAKSLYTFVIRN